jgi:BirA family biotin operon repressor/biotin-[acetyl-CoA-carboxylase] ligase
MPASLPEGETAKLGFVAGLALEDAVRKVAPSISVRVALDAGEGSTRLRLKWPNDLLVDGAKLAGILLETVTNAAGSRQVVIGFGVNVAEGPDGTPYPVTSLSRCGAAVSAEELFHQLSDSWTALYAVWDEGRGFPAIRDLWLGHAAGLGAPIAVSTGGTVLRGVFETLDNHGMLVVRDSAGGVRKVAAGDVHFGVAATAGR